MDQEPKIEAAQESGKEEILASIKQEVAKDIAETLEVIEIVKVRKDDVLDRVMNDVLEGLRSIESKVNQL